MRRTQVPSNAAALRDIAAATRIHIGNPNAPRANVSNAGYMMGDPTFGDPFDEGDPSFIGDPSFEGDPTFGDPIDHSIALANYATIIGDPAHPARKHHRGLDLRNRFNNLPKGAKIGLGAAGVAGLGLGAYAIAHKAHQAHQANLQRKNRLRQAQQMALHKNTSAAAVYARQNLAKIHPAQPMSFYQVSGASVSVYPIAPTKHFVMKSLTWTFDQQANNSPFVAYVVNATQPGGAGTDYIVNIPGTSDGQYYPGIFIVIGGNILQSSPNINFNVTATLPLVGGQTLSISTVPFTFTLGNKFDCKIALFPWTLVAAEPTYTSGFFTAAAPINVHVSGSIPNPASISVVVPGTLHPWTIGMRNAGI